MTLQTFYNKLNNINYKIGLFWEFVRYFHCEWPSIYIFQQIGDKWLNKAQYDIDEFMHGEFDQNMNKILNQLISNKDDFNNNTQIIGQRTKLFDKLKNELDISQIKKVKEDEHLDMHITHNQYDINVVTHDLLTLDNQICKVIKNMTILLRFDWEYSQYC